MKTLSILLAAIVLTASSISFAGNGERILKKKISNAIKYPSLKSDEKVETTVTAWVKVDEEGKVKVTGMTAKTPEAASAIKEQLERISNVPSEELAGRTFVYKFVLKVQ
jgi:hypothetical protein